MKYFWCALIFLSLPSLSQEIKEVQVEIKTDKGDKEIAIRKAVDQISRKFVESFLGQEKYQENKKNIKKNIIRNQNRYILFSKSSPSVPQNDGKFLTTVTLGISEKNLEGLLIEHNLFYRSQGSLCIVPVIAFTVDVNEKESYLWWLDKNQNNLAGSLAEDFYHSLALHVIKSGFYSLDPVFSRFYEGLPESILRKTEKSRNIKPLSNFLQCHLILSGRISLKKNTENHSLISHFAFKIFNTQTDQVLFKLRKKILVPKMTPPLKKVRIKKAFDEISQRILTSMAYQLATYREKGALDLNRLFLAIQGPLTYFEREALEKALVHHIPSIKSLQKRYMASHRAVYEMKSDRNIAKVADVIKKTVIPNYQIKVTTQNKKQLELYARTQTTRKNKKPKTLN